ncbi:hypothetical protein HY637_05680 [Candidatus Woesearchaeota archaeon]|nr:hypothetical protein [Candidatus Woesearchaeota archaeon]
MKSFVKILGIALFLLSLLAAIIYSDAEKFDLSMYPYPFIANNTVTALVVIGPDSADLSAANNVLASLEWNNFYVREEKPIWPIHDGQGLKLTYPYIQIANKSTINSSVNTVVVGGPCANEAAAVLMNTSQKWPECAKGFEEGKSIIRIYQTDQRTHLLVAGYSKRDTTNAVYILKDYLRYNLSGLSIEVSGDITKELNIKEALY